MPLKVLLANEDEFKKLPDVLKTEYVKQDDGTYVLDTEDGDYKKKIDEFRNNNRALKKQHDQVNADLAKFKDIDPEAYQAALDAKQKLEKLEQDNLAKAGNFDELLAKRTEAMRVDYEKRQKALNDSRSEAETKAGKYRESLRALRIDGSVRDSVSKVGNVRTGAMVHLLNMARQTWQLDDNDELVAPDKFDDKGQPMTLDFWAKQTMQEHPYLFESAQGGGAQGGRAGGSPRNAGGKQVLNAPSATEFGGVGADRGRLEKIASGEIEVNLPVG